MVVSVDRAVEAVAQERAEVVGSRRDTRPRAARGPRCRTTFLGHAAPVDEHGGAAALLQVQRDADADDAGAEDERVSRGAFCREIRRLHAAATSWWVTLPRDVEPVPQVRIVGERAPPALVGEREDERQRGVVERIGRGARHRARHVRHAVMHHTVDYVGRVGVRRRARGLEAAALVDRDVHHDRALLHLLHHLPADELRRGRARNEHRADHEVGRKTWLLDRVAARMHRDHARAELLSRYS